MLEQRLIPESKYGIKCPYIMTPEGITIHNTANDASADNEASYMTNNNNEVSFHIVVDDIKSLQLIPFNRNSWHAGDGNGRGNRKMISMEICYSKSGGDRFDKAERNGAKVTAYLLKQFGWGIDKVYKHQDFSGKYCPHRTLDMGWQRFLNMVQGELNGTSKPSNEMYRVRKSWGDTASQIGAYTELNNAKRECDKRTGYSVYDGNGNVIYTNSPKPTQPPTKAKVDVFTKVDGYSWVKNLEDYAGDKKTSIEKVFIYPSNGEVLFRVSPINRDYYPWVQNYKSANGIYDFAGDGKTPIDRIQCKLRGLDGYSIKYRAFTAQDGWLPWVVNDSDFAGIKGKAILAIEVKIE